MKNVLLVLAFVLAANFGLSVSPVQAEAKTAGTSATAGTIAGVPLTTALMAAVIVGAGIAIANDDDSDDASSSSSST